MPGTKKKYQEGKERRKTRKGRGLEKSSKRRLLTWLHENLFTSGQEQKVGLMLHTIAISVSAGQCQPTVFGLGLGYWPAPWPFA